VIECNASLCSERRATGGRHRALRGDCGDDERPGVRRASTGERPDIGSAEDVELLLDSIPRIDPTKAVVKESIAESSVAMIFED
jgi:hypothetical protein